MTLRCEQCPQVTLRSVVAAVLPPVHHLYRPAVRRSRRLQEACESPPCHRRLRRFATMCRSPPPPSHQPSVTFQICPELNFSLTSLRLPARPGGSCAAWQPADTLFSCFPPKTDARLESGDQFGFTAALQQLYSNFTLTFTSESIWLDKVKLEEDQISLII